MLSSQAKSALDDSAPFPASLWGFCGPFFLQRLECQGLGCCGRAIPLSSCFSSSSSSSSLINLASLIMIVFLYSFPLCLSLLILQF